MATHSSTVVPNALIPLVFVAFAVAMHLSLSGAAVGDLPSWRSTRGNNIDDDAGATWGLPDAVAPVGKLFEYRLSREPDGDAGVTADDAVGFGLTVDGSGDVAGREKSEGDKWIVYQLNEKGDRVTLPDWLTMDADTGKLYGVADQGCLGNHYRIMVQNNDRLNSESAMMADEFSIRVIDDTSSSWSESARQSSRGTSNAVARSPSSKLSPVRCPHGLSLTTATVVLDADLTLLSAADRVRLIVNFARHFRLPASLFRLRPPPADRPLLDLNSALAAGPGDLAAGSTPLHAGLLVQWDVGCGNVRAELMPSLELLETSAADGRLGQAIVGRPAVIGWHIAKMTRGAVGVGSSHRATKHAPRFVASTATPALPIAIMPTQRPDVITMTVQTPPPTVVVTTPTTTNVVIVPTATMTSPLATATWPTTESSRGPTSWTTHVDEIVETTTGSLPTVEHKSEEPMTSQTTLTQMVVTTPNVPVSKATKRPPKTTTLTQMTSSVSATEAIVHITDVISDVITDVITEDITEVITDAEVTTSAAVVVVQRTVSTLQPSVTTYEPTTSVRHVATTALPSVVTTPSVPVSKATKRPPKTTTTRITRLPNQPPEPRRPIGRLNVTAGSILWFPIPNDTFIDREDGATNNLHLLLQKPDGLELTPMSWIKLNTSARTLFGLPMDVDIGRHQYILAAVDSEGRVAKSAFEVVVDRGPSIAWITHEISVVLDIDFQEFLYKGVERRLEVASRLAAAFGDPDPSRITVTDIRPGSVVYSWTNNSVPMGPECPVDQVQQLAERVVEMRDGSTNAEFAAAMHPLPVQRAEFRPLGACANVRELWPGGTMSLPSSTIRSPGIGNPEPVPVTSVDTLLLIVVVAMVVVGVLLVLLVILCIICCCRARRRSEKQRRQRDDELSCANKGIPVIFADELDEDDDRKSSGTIGRGNGNGSQMTPDDTPASTLKRRVRHADEVHESSPSPNGGVGSAEDDDDGPRVPPPPEYPRSDPASRTSTLKSDYKAPLLSDDDSDDERSEKPSSHGNEDDDHNKGAGTATTRPLYHPQPPNTDSLPPYKKL